MKIKKKSKRLLKIFAFALSFVISILSVNCIALSLDDGTFFEANLSGEKYAIKGEKYVVLLTFENFAQNEFIGASAYIDYDANVFEVDSTYLGIINGEIAPENGSSETYPLINPEDGWAFWGNNSVVDNTGTFSVNVLNDMDSEINSLKGNKISCFVEFKVKDVNDCISEFKIDTDDELIGVFSETLIESKKGTGSTLSAKVVKEIPITERKLVLKSNSGYSINSQNISSIESVGGIRENTSVLDFKSNFENEANNLRVVFEDKILDDYQKVPTAAEIQLVIDDKILDKKIISCKGDVDCSGDVSSTDYLIIKSYFLKLKTLDGILLASADIDNNYVIDTTDYLKIKSYFLGTTDIYSWYLRKEKEYD